MTLALAGLVAGMVHVLSGPDHLAAVAPYAVADRAGRWRTGVRWGLGHSAGVVGVGLLLLTVRHALPIEVLSARGELAVGLAVLGIGVWGIRAALVCHHQGHGHGHAVFAVGTLHGLAGSSHLLGILPALALPSDALAGAYLLCFGIGSVAAMGTFTSLVGWIAGRPIAGGAGAQRALLGLSSVIATAVGGFWILASIPVTPSLWSLR